MPGAHVVTSSQEIVGTPLTVALMFTTTRFAEANPKIVQAIYDASVEALQMIKTDTRRAVKIYRTSSKDKLTTDELLAMLKEPGMMAFETTPQGTMVFARHLAKTGMLKTEPKSWSEFFLPIAHAHGGS